MQYCRQSYFVFIYIDSLFSVLRRNRTVCWINGMYAGIMGYADDMWLLSPDGLQEMVQICSDYYKNLNLSFSTHPDSRSKTKCIAYTKRKPCEKLCLMGVNYHGSLMQNIWCTRLVLR